MGKSSVGYRMAMFGLEDHSRPVRGADYFAGHFAHGGDDEEEAAAAVLERYGESAVFTYAMTHVFVDPGAGNRPVKGLPEQLRRNLERVRARE